MDSKAVGGVDLKLPTEVLVPTSSISDAEEKHGADSPTESNLLGVSASADLAGDSLLQSEIPEPNCEDDAEFLAHDAVESTPLELTSSCNLKDVSPLEYDTVEKSDSLQSIPVHCSASSLPGESKSDSTNSHVAADGDCEHQVQSLSSPVTSESSSLHGQDSGIHSIGSRDNVQKPVDENKDNFTQGQLHNTAVDVVSTEDVRDPQLETGGIHSTTDLSDLNSSESETQITVSHLETAAAVAAEPPAAHSDHESVYYIKWIMFGTRNVPIITQNENGPCPLLAIMNVLLLKEKVKLAPMLEMITSEQLMTYLGECIFENMPQNLTETTQANYEQNMQDAMSVMYKLQTGLDVNVKFTGVGDFEYTPELIVFDLLGISLYHGWLVDPQDLDTLRAVGQCSYNQLVENIICLRQTQQEEENVRQALIAEQFLDRTASQLTYHGLCELSSVIKEKELCVFFRNNHFNTLYKNNNELFLLATDQGFLTESNVVWETLSTVDGDCHFTDATFRTYTKPAPATTPVPDSSVPVGSPEQIDHDYQVALFLQEEDASLQNQAWGSGLPQEQTSYTDADHEYAMRLQEEENRQIAEHERTAGVAASDTASQHGQGNYLGRASPAEGPRRRVERAERKEKEDKSCLIL